VENQILIIDDDQRMLDAMRRSLHHEDDWAITFIRQPEAAWEALLRAATTRVVSGHPHAGHGRNWNCWTYAAIRKTKDIPVVSSPQWATRDLKEKIAEARRGRSAEQAGGCRAVGGAAAERAASQEIPGMSCRRPTSCWPTRFSGRRSIWRIRRMSVICRLGHGGRIPRRGDGGTRGSGWGATAGPSPPN